MSGGGGRQRAPTVAPRVPRREDEPLTASADSPGLGNRPRSLSFPSVTFKHGAGSSGKIQVFLPRASGSPPTGSVRPSLQQTKGATFAGEGLPFHLFRVELRLTSSVTCGSPVGPGARPRPAGQAALLLGCWAPGTGRLASCWTVMPLPPQLPTQWTRGEVFPLLFTRKTTVWVQEMLHVTQQSEAAARSCASHQVSMWLPPRLSTCSSVP